MQISSNQIKIKHYMMLLLQALLSKKSTKESQTIENDFHTANYQNVKFSLVLPTSLMTVTTQDLKTVLDQQEKLDSTMNSFFSLFSGLIKQSLAAELPEWTVLGDFRTTLLFQFDPLVIGMLIVIGTISLSVHIYSVGYIDKQQIRSFLVFLTLFVICMSILVMASNLMLTFLGWEGVGLTSYLLIAFWHERLAASKAAIKAMLINRFGDISLLLAIYSIFFVFRTVDNTILSNLAENMKDLSFLLSSQVTMSAIETFAIFLIIAAVGKSAQIGLHIWLPDAMEGPTPVSALLHAATMVTAGVYIILRLANIIQNATHSLTFISIIGGLTAVFAGTCGIVQNDVKRIIAFSTCSQLGYMFVCCSLAQFQLAWYHLFTHAFFKALLFLSAGSIIHSVMGEQDIRKFGSLLKKIPLTFILILIGSLSLLGFPFLAGFYSKDLIIESAYSINWTTIVFVCCLSAAMLTTFYSVRLIYYVFIMTMNVYKQKVATISEDNNWLLRPMMFLGILSMVAGFLAKDLFVGLGTDIYYDIFPTSPMNLAIINAEFSPQLIKLSPFILTVIVFLLTLVLYEIKNFYVNLNKFLITVSWAKNLFRFFSNKWLFDKVYLHGISIYMLDNVGLFFKKKNDLFIFNEVEVSNNIFYQRLINQRIKTMDGNVLSYVQKMLMFVLFTQPLNIILWFGKKLTIAFSVVVVAIQTRSSAA